MSYGSASGLSARVAIHTFYYVMTGWKFQWLFLLYITVISRFLSLQMFPYQRLLHMCLFAHSHLL